jgi:hypothetical protein
LHRYLAKCYFFNYCSSSSYIYIHIFIFIYYFNFIDLFLYLFLFSSLFLTSELQNYELAMLLNRMEHSKSALYRDGPDIKLIPAVEVSFQKKYSLNVMYDGAKLDQKYFVELLDLDTSNMVPPACILLPYVLVL